MKPEDLVKGKDYLVCSKFDQFIDSHKKMFIKNDGGILTFYDYYIEAIYRVGIDVLKSQCMIKEYHEPIKKVVEKEGYAVTYDGELSEEYFCDYLTNLELDACAYPTHSLAEEALKFSERNGKVLKFKSRIELEEVVE